MAPKRSPRLRTSDFDRSESSLHALEIEPDVVFAFDDRVVVALRHNFALWWCG
jgi:hypothetical protein